MIELLLALAGAAHQDAPQWPDRLVLECQPEARSTLSRSDGGWTFDAAAEQSQPFVMRIDVANRIAQGWGADIEVTPSGLRIDAGSRILDADTREPGFNDVVYILGAPDDREFLFLLTLARRDGGMHAAACRRLDHPSVR